MPGRKPSDASWRWTCPLKKYRQVTAADATIAAVTEILDLRYPEATDVQGVQQAYDNVLYLGFLFPATVTSISYRVLVEATPSNNVAATGWVPVTGDQYAIISDATITKPALVALRDVFPALVKVMIYAYVGAGTVSIVYARSE